MRVCASAEAQQCTSCLHEQGALTCLTDGLAQTYDMDVPLLLGYYNKTYLAIRPYSPDTFIMISPPIGRVRLRYAARDSPCPQLLEALHALQVWRVWLTCQTSG